ncbi:TetR/AcrR family transcriptional regulator [Tissierella pigra]|uniref:TetR/AcrR family transcriptional regulator n=1 Tax=Tissierella pigra TaxID=2607614 RepID=UPI001C0FD3A9|nr:TetR/AcrR family transcriptional regulator [Tissierella pigra]MBU5426283.1 TetR/AcrR family transcriptional regulator [Tissierella pigra]
MKATEVNQTKDWVVEAILKLLEKKEYRDITISQIVNKADIGRRTFYRYFKSKDDIFNYIGLNLANDFAQTILNDKADSLFTISTSYFKFWESHIDTLLLMKKAHLLYFIEDNLFEIIYKVAIKIGHIEEQNVDENFMDRYKYEFEFKLAGFWKLTLLWCTEMPRKTPEEMAKIIYSIVK